MKLLVAYAKGNKNLLKIGLDDGTEKWATTTASILEFAKANFQKEEEAKFETTEKHGQITVTRIYKADGSKDSNSTSPKPVATPTTAEYKCSDCGKVLKDGKYPKCFDCNKKNPAKASEPRSPSIERQAMMKASAQAVATALQGQVGDVSVLAEMIISVYEKLLKKIQE